jgi:CRP-like cAMP-binding protein
MPVSSMGGTRAERDEQDMSLKAFLRQGAGFGGSRGGGSLLSRIPSAESTVSDRGRISNTERSSGQSSPTLSTMGDRDVSPMKGIDYNGSQGEFRGSLLGLNERISSFERVGSDSSSSFKKAPMGTGIQLNKNMFALKREMLAQVFDNLKILRELEEPLKEEVMEMFTSHRYSAGKCVIEKGEQFSSYFVILDGSVGLFVKEDDENQDDSAKTDYSSSGRYIHRNETDSDDSSKGVLFQPQKFSSGGINGDLFKGILKKSESAGGGVMDQSMADVHSLAKRNMKKLSKVVKNMTLLQTLKAKATFGEICLVAPMPSKHTVRAMEDTTILQLNAFDFYRAKQRFFRNMFEERVKLLQHAPFAALLTADMMANLADACVTCRYENGDNITCEANENSSQKFFMVMDGQAALLKPVKGEAETSEFQGDWSRVRTVETFLPNSCFGQDALEDPTIDMDIEKVRLSPTIVAVKHCTCISIDRGTFRNLVGSYEAIMAEIQGEKHKKKSVAAFSGVASAAMLFRGVSLRRMSRRMSSVASPVEQATPSAASSAGAGLLAAIKRKVSSVEEETAQEAQKTVPEPTPAGGVGGAGDSGAGGGGGGLFAEAKAKWRQWPSVVSWASSTHLIRVYSGEEDAGTEAGPASTDDGQILAGRVDKGKGDGGGAFGNDDKGKAAPGTFINMPSVVTWAQQKRDFANAAEEALEAGGPADVGGLVVGDGDGDGDGDGGQGGGEGIEQGRVSPSSLMKGLEQVHKQQQVQEGRRYSSSGAALRIGSSGSRAKTPGGGVALDPEGADRIPSHFSPAVTPLQSRQGSRMISRGSGGSGDRSMSRGGKVCAMIQGEFSPKNIKRTVMEAEGSDEEGFTFAASASDEPESEEGEFGDDSDGDEDEAGLNLAHGRKQHLSEEGKNVKLPHLKDATPSKTPSKERGLMGVRSGSRTGTGSKSPGAEGLGDARSSRSSRGKSDLDFEVFPFFSNESSAFITCTQPQTLNPKP